MVLGLILYEVSVVGGGVNGFLGEIFYWHTVVGNNTYSTYTKNGRRDTQCPPLQTRLRGYTITKKENRRCHDCRFPYKHCNLRGYFDEMRRILNF